MLLENKIDYNCPDCKIPLVDFSAQSAEYSGLCKNCRRIFNKEFLRQMESSKFKILSYSVQIGDLPMNQEMTPVDETKNKRLNAPSEASEQACYNQGYKDGLLRAAEEIEKKSQFAAFNVQKVLTELKLSIATILFDTEAK